jgi:hypothetical protein
LVNAVSPLPPFLADLLSAPPRAGEGIHNWLFRVARQLHAHLPAGEIVRLLQNRVATCGRHVPQSEILSAVQNSLACAWTPRGNIAPFHKPAAKWPSVNTEARAAIIRDTDAGLVDLWEASQHRLEDNAAHTETLVDMLFPGDPLLCCGKSNREFDTKHREAWRGQLAELALIVPSSMTAPTGQTKDGRQSAHTLDNTGPRRFLVVEFDTGTTDDHAALLLHLAGKGPLVLAVHSGGKSLHGWFRAAGASEEKLMKFFRYAVSLGADPATWTRSQFVRMPDGRRDNGARQTVFFFHPKILPRL